MTDLVTIITALAAKYGPASVDLAMAAIRMSGIASLIQGFAFGCVAVAAGFAIRWLAVQEQEDEDNSVLFTLMLCFGLLALGGTVAFFAQMFDVWNWVAIFSPETYAAVKLMHLGGR